jgi:hypothetical protein
MGRAAEDPTIGEDRAGGNVTIDLRAFEVDVPLPGGDIVRVDPREHRDDVVRRLLLLGASERTLTTLLPEWKEGVRRVAEELRADGLLERLP